MMTKVLAHTVYFWKLKKRESSSRMRATGFSWGGYVGWGGGRVTQKPKKYGYTETALLNRILSPTWVSFRYVSNSLHLSSYRPDSKPAVIPGFGFVLDDIDTNGTYKSVKFVRISKMWSQNRFRPHNQRKNRPTEPITIEVASCFLDYSRAL
jgi:hypothetical protein